MTEVTPSGLRLPDGTLLPWYAAEFHYWRNERRHWPAIFARLREAGFTIATSFVQWNAHEFEPGRLDFTGQTAAERDLVAWTRMAGQAGLYTHLRLGPGCCEWRVSGASSFGTPWAVCARQFAQALAGETVARGGSVVAVQVDNEWVDPLGMYEGMYAFRQSIDGFHAIEVPAWIELGEPNFHYRSAGEDWSLDRLAEDLAHRYVGDIGSLNEAWGRDYASFAEVVADYRAGAGETFAGLVDHLSERFRGLAPGRNLREFHDIARWIKRYKGIPLRKHVAAIRKRMDVLITHNWAMGSETDFNKLAHLDLSGYDHYRHVDVDIREWTFLAKDMQECRLPYLAEFMCGTIERYLWGGQGVYRPDFARLSVLSFFAEGIRAINLYMFVERDNWLQCPVDDRGGIRPSFEAHSQVVHALRHCEFHHRTRCADVAVVRLVPALHERTKDLYSDRGFPFPWIRARLYGGLDVKQATFDLYTALHELHLDFAAFRADEELQVPDSYKVLLVPCVPFMERKVAEALVARAEAGATVLLFPRVPEYDLEGNPLDELTGRLGRSSVNTVSTRAIRCAHLTVEADGPVSVRPLEGGTPIFSTAEGATAGTRAGLGCGALIALGFLPQDAPPVLRHLVEELAGARAFATTDVTASDANAFLLEGGDPVILVYNGNFESAVTELGLHPGLLEKGQPYVVCDLLARRALGTVGRQDDERVRVPFHLPPRDAGVVGLCRSAPAGFDAAPPEVADVPLTGWRARHEPLAPTVAAYAGPETDESWIEVGAGEWTLPALASGKTFGVQGWFWLKANVEIPSGLPEPIELELAPVAWQNLLCVYANGQPAGTLAVERPGACARFDLTRFVRPGERATVAIRLLRQSLDCHDKGASGFSRCGLRAGRWEHSIFHWSLKQECRDWGEREGWPAADLTQWDPLDVPGVGTLQRNTDYLWLGARVDLEDPRGLSHLALDARDVEATVFVNGTYAGRTPYVPVRLPLAAPLARGANTIVLRLAANPDALYNWPGDDRFRGFVLNGLDEIPVRLESIRLGGGQERVE